MPPLPTIQTVPPHVDLTAGSIFKLKTPTKISRLCLLFKPHLAGPVLEDQPACLGYAAILMYYSGWIMYIFSLRAKGLWAHAVILGQLAVSGS